MQRRKLLDALYQAAEAYIPLEELTPEQEEKLLNVHISFCSCDICAHAAGHANRKTYEIGISKKHFEELGGTDQGPCVGFFLLVEIQWILHEIIHILFPDLSEKQVRRKTKAWLRRSEWVRRLE